MRFRHFWSGSVALASLNHTCRNLVPTFPQRSPPWLLTAAACGGMRSTPDCRPRRTLLHLSYSYAAPCGPALLVTQGHLRTLPYPFRFVRGFTTSRAQSTTIWVIGLGVRCFSVTIAIVTLKHRTPN